MKKLLNFIFLFFVLIFLSGCSTLTYVGEDYAKENIQTVKTNEDFIFNVYKKSLTNTDVKVGISRTPINELLVLYIKIDNFSYDTSYLFKVSDLIVSSGGENIRFITSNNYLNIWQTQEAATIMQAGAMANTITTMTGMTTNYNEINQGTLQNASQQVSNNTFSNMSNIAAQIQRHSIKTSYSFNPRKSQYFYFFFENPNNEINVNYKNLQYKFKI